MFGQGRTPYKSDYC